MPYSLPPTVAASVPGRQRHRRSYASTDSIDGTDPASGFLPRLTPPTAASQPKPSQGSRFHFNENDDSTPSGSEDEDGNDHLRPPVKLNPKSSLHLNLTVNLPTMSPNVRKGGVPFPRSSPLLGPGSPATMTASPAPFSPAPPPSHHSGVNPTRVIRPVVARTSSSPVILLSNGKPLKSSLKSSSSSPAIHTRSISHHGFPHSHHHHTHSAHLRAASAPATPHDDGTPDPETPGELFSPPLSASSSCESVPGTPKNVHFASNLSSVKLFSRRAKPAALLEADGDSAVGDETEETEEDEGYGGMPGYGYPGRRRYSTASQGAFPFPKFFPPATQSKESETKSYAIAPSPSTSHIPASFPSPHANVHMESVSLTNPSSSPPSGSSSTSLNLAGTVFVRNLAFAKDVAVRFTLDEWQTTSEVSARYVDSHPSLPSTFFNPSSSSSSSGTWDRFAFSINLEDHAHALHERTLWMVARFTINPHSQPHTEGGGREEWWDNNCGRNYRVGFVLDSSTSPGGSKTTTPTSGTANANGTPFRERARARGLSAPPAPIPFKPLPPLTLPPHVSYNPSPPPNSSTGQPATRLQGMKPATQISIPSYSPPAASYAYAQGRGSYVQGPGERESSTEAFRQAANKTTSERLKRLSLMNYAKPGTSASSSSPGAKSPSSAPAATAGSSPGAPSSAPTTPSAGSGPSTPTSAPVAIDTSTTTSPFPPNSSPNSNSGSTASSPISAVSTSSTSANSAPPTLVRSSSASSSCMSDDEDEDEELRTPDLDEDDDVPREGEGMQTPKVKGGVEFPLMGDTTKASTAGAPSSASSDTGSETDEPEKVLTPNLSSVTTESAYEAFLKQWCFASTSGPGSPVPFTSTSAADAIRSEQSARGLRIEAL